jgi:hypothetical protein
MTLMNFFVGRVTRSQATPHEERQEGTLGSQLAPLTIALKFSER